MAIHVVCPNGHQLHVAEKYAGKRGRCPKCRGVVVIPAPDESGSEEDGHLAEEDAPAVTHSTSELTAHTPMAKQRKPDTRRKEIRGYIERSGTALLYASSHANAWLALIFLLLFLGMGTALFLVGVGVIALEIEPRILPMLQGAGVLIVLVMVAALVGAIRSIRHLHRVEALRELHPDEPWLADFRWDPKRSLDNTHHQKSHAFSKGVGGFAGAIIIWYLLPLFIDYDHIVPRDHYELISTAIVLFALAGFFGYGLWFLAKAVYLTAHLQKYGRSEARFQRFPFFLGEKLEVSFVPSRDVGEVSRIRFTLRCVEEVIVLGRHDQATFFWGKGLRVEKVPEQRRRSRTRLVHYQIWADTIAFRKTFYLGAGRNLPITFVLPEGPEFTSNLASQTMRHWELVVWAETAGIDFEAMFLVPVYARPKRRKRNSSTGRAFAGG